jgi:hypothetical protein
MRFHRRVGLPTLALVVIALGFNTLHAQISRARRPRTGGEEIPRGKALVRTYYPVSIADLAAHEIESGNYCRAIDHAQHYCDCRPRAAAIRALPAAPEEK